MHWSSLCGLGTARPGVIEAGGRRRRKVQGTRVPVPGYPYLPRTVPRVGYRVLYPGTTIWWFEKILP